VNTVDTVKRVDRMHRANRLSGHFFFNDGHDRPSLSAKLQHTAAHCNTLQHTATHCTILHHTGTLCLPNCNTLQHTVIHCNTMRHTAPHRHSQSAVPASVRGAGVS